MKRMVLISNVNDPTGNVMVFHQLCSIRIEIAYWKENEKKKLSMQRMMENNFSTSLKTKPIFTMDWVENINTQFYNSFQPNGVLTLFLSE